MAISVTSVVMGTASMVHQTSGKLRSPEHRLEVLKRTHRHTGEKIFALEAELAHRDGYIGADETTVYFANILAKDD